MSEVMEKTLASVSGFLLSTVAPRNTDISPGFNNLVRTVCRARSKSDEEKAVKKELELLKSKLSQPDIGLKKTKEYLIRLMYCEMLGQSASFGYIYALKLAQQGTLVNKRVGYLAVSLFLHENHELVLLLINTLQRDMRSTNMLDNCMALSVLCKLVSADMIPAMLPLVEEKLQHPRAMVRKKAVMVLQRFYHKAPHLIQNMHDKFKHALCDKDPTVMCAALHIYHDLIQANPADHLQLVRPLVSILDQVISRKLPSDFDYHGVPAPWLQILLLKMLAKLGAIDEKSSSMIHGVLDEMFQKASLSQNIAFAVQYECIMTVTSISPNQDLLEKSALCINKFIKSRNNNLKYLGISALSAILEVSPPCAIQHQTTVIDCLEDSDATIRFKTLELLYRMTNKSNISIVCKRLMSFLNTTKEDYVRRDLINKISQLADKYHPTVRWYMDAMTMLILTGGNNVPTNIVHNIINALSQGNSNIEVKQHAMQLYLPFAEKENIPETLVQLIAWVLGDCCSIPDAPPAEDLLPLLCTMLDRPYDNTSTSGWIIAAMVKVVAYGQIVTDDVMQALKRYKMSQCMDIRQRIYELETLCNNMEFVQATVPSKPDAELQFDSTLTFLDDYVSEALDNGAAPYKPRQQRHTEKQPSPEEVKPVFAGLNFHPYENPPSLASGDSATLSSLTPPDKASAHPSMPIDKDIAHPHTPTLSVSSGGSGRSNDQDKQEMSSGLKLKGVRRVWGQHGYSRPKLFPTRKPKVKAVTSDATVSPVPSKNGSQASTQMSSVQAKGITSKHGCAQDETEEERQKKELARALFGGMQQEMERSKAPIDRKRQLFLQREENLLQEQLLSSNEVSFLDGETQQEQLNRGQLIDLNQQQNSNLESGLDIDNLVSSSKRPIDLLKQSPDVNAGGAGLGHGADLEGKPEKESPAPTSIYDEFKQDLESSLNDVQTEDSNSFNHPARELVLDRNIDERIEDQPENDLLGNHNGASETTNGHDLLSLDTTKHAISYNQTDNKQSLLDIDPSATIEQPINTAHSPSGNKDQPISEACLPSDMACHPHSKEYVELCSDAVVRVTLCKVWKPDALGLVFFMHNQSQTHPVEDFVMKLELPSNFKCLASPSEEQTPLTIDFIECASVKHIVTGLTTTTPALNMSLGGQISYKDYTKTNRRMFFNTPISIRDLLRPKEMSTSDYGQLWPTLTHDHRLTFGEVKADSVSKVMTLIEDSLQMFPVDVIGNEGISSATLLGSAPCLLHSKLTGKQLDCWIKSASQILSDTIAKHCSTMFT